MRKFFVSILTISVFFVGLGALVEKAGAKFKSDEKALEIIRAARTAIGGEANLREVRSLVIVGKTTHSVRMNDIEKSETGETEIALQMPDKMLKSIKIGDGNAAGGKVMADRHEIVITGKAEGDKITWERKDGEFTTSDGKKIVIKKGDNAEFTTEDGKKVIVRSTEKSATATATIKGDGESHVIVRKQGDGGEWKTEDGKNVQVEKVRMPRHDGMRQNELLRTTLGLLLTAPEGMDVVYTFVGEDDVDGTVVNIVNAAFGGANYKLFIGKSNNLPVAISFKGHEMPVIMHFNKESPAPKDGEKDVVIFKRHDEIAGKSAEMMIKFSEFRATGGVQLPYKWTTVSGDKTIETFDVTTYDVNPANIADRFKDQQVTVRMKHPDSK